jgi:hypothetical protein
MGELEISKSDCPNRSQIKQSCSPLLNAYSNLKSVIVYRPLNSIIVQVLKIVKQTKLRRSCNQRLTKVVNGTISFRLGKPQKSSSLSLGELGMNEKGRHLGAIC